MKKAQIQFMELIFVLLILIVIIFIGMFLYFSFSVKDIKEKGEEFSDIDATIILDSIIGMPEITCGTNCIDTVKVMLFDSSADREYYRALFKNMGIILRKIYPESNTASKTVECSMTMYQQIDYPDNCDYYIINQGNRGGSKEIIQNVVSIYYPETDSYAFGLIQIEVFK